MKKLLLVTAALITLSMILTGTFAYASDIDRRISEMQTRISQGVNSGQLTRQEAQVLNNELNGIRRDEARMRADGKLTKPEVQRLNRELDRISKNIHREKTDKDNVVSDTNRRVSEMQARINQGIKSGELTRPEAHRLTQELNKIKNEEARMKADGRLTKQEYQRLSRELDSLAKDIYREKHDSQKQKIGLSSVNSEAGDSICAGQWNMVANKDFAFILKIHQKGTKIYGSMTRTDGNEPVDSIDGSCHPDRTITFTRVRKGQWQQHYRGKVSRADFISGSFTDDNGQYRWTAKR